MGQEEGAEDGIHVDVLAGFGSVAWASSALGALAREARGTQDRANSSSWGENMPRWLAFSLSSEANALVHPMLQNSPLEFDTRLTKLPHTPSKIGIELQMLDAAITKPTTPVKDQHEIKDILAFK